MLEQLAVLQPLAQPVEEAQAQSPEERRFEKIRWFGPWLALIENRTARNSHAA